jgi:hypothetical protein
MNNEDINNALVEAKRLSKWIASTDDSLESDETETVKWICDAFIALVGTNQLVETKKE